jgi:hypothetical protein
MDTLEKPGMCGDSRAFPGSFSSGSAAEVAMPNMRRQAAFCANPERTRLRRMSSPNRAAPA